MGRIDTALAWMQDRRGRVTYSMANRWGPGSYDCSSSVYFALKAAGLLPDNTPIGNTDSLFNDLERAGFTRLQPDATGDVKVRRGDVFIWGVRGASTGSAGHTGFFVDDNENIIHCNYSNNGITIQNHNAYWAAAYSPQYTFYRPPADGAAPVARSRPAAAQAQQQRGSTRWTPASGWFTASARLAVSNDTDPNSPSQGWYAPGQGFAYDGWVAENGYVWLTYTNAAGRRRFIAIGPNDGNPATTWGEGF